MDKNYIPLSVKVSSMLLDTDDGETYSDWDIRCRIRKTNIL